MDIKKITETITRAYGVHETQHGRTAEMTIDQIRNQTDLTDSQIRQGMYAIGGACRGRTGDLGTSGDVLERM